MVFDSRQLLTIAVDSRQWTRNGIALTIWYWSGFCKASCRQGEEGGSYVKRDVKRAVSGFAASFLLTTAVVSSDLLAAGSAHALDSTIVQTAFQRACVGCHVGGGNIIQPGATLTSSDLQRNGLSSTDDIYKIIYSGKGRMPGFGELCAPRGQCTFGPRLSDKEIRSLADFVRLQADQGWKQGWATLFPWQAVKVIPRGLLTLKALKENSSTQSNQTGTRHLNHHKISPKTMFEKVIQI
ncbi:hypothetical protein L7F22_028376 [Adiantum nelumboides]|nr:hypothetical protein [Adiantum nelumboides]